MQSVHTTYEFISYYSCAYFFAFRHSCCFCLFVGPAHCSFQFRPKIYGDYVGSHTNWLSNNINIIASGYATPKILGKYGSNDLNFK